MPIKQRNKPPLEENERLVAGRRPHQGVIFYVRTKATPTSPRRGRPATSNPTLPSPIGLAARAPPNVGAGRPRMVD